MLIVVNNIYCTPVSIICFFSLASKNFPPMPGNNTCGPKEQFYVRFFFSAESGKQLLEATRDNCCPTSVIRVLRADQPPLVPRKDSQRQKQWGLGENADGGRRDPNNKVQKQNIKWEI